MAEIWKSLPSWVRNIVVPILVLIIAFNVLGIVFSVISSLVWFAVKALVVVGIAAGVVILVKRAAKG
ncbi:MULTISPECIES: DUF5326 family protein [unclassified Kitasatospora]|uniref:DUF5326 family protein n=1 Tax=unclassified Kitasatospora TaxID=2633591 RepID=UPI0024744F45|nr:MULTISPECIES: DUF5326 family protein [unclassified Kitasatospora]MDH6119592.1 putative membrane protein [Kitasatospora sp. GAS204B]